MKVKNAMNPKVVVATRDITVKEAARIMTKFRIGSLVILENEKIIGIVTESDIIRKIVATGNDPAGTLIEQVMTKNVVTIGSEKDLGDACQLMVDHKIKRLPVLQDGKLVGIITTTDIIAVEPKLIENLAKVMLVSQNQMVAG